TYIYWNALSRKGLFFQYSFDYADRHRDELQAAYPTAAAFVSDFDLDARLFEAFLRYAEKRGVPRDAKSIAEHQDKMKLTLKAYIGRDVYDDLGFYPVYLLTDDDYKAAVLALHTM
ncbi:MAG: hypothetical protein K2H70_03855, partial [Bacteroidales bacterium]|nr:hypothetical protein [Bacteroidales bacterium]